MRFLAKDTPYKGTTISVEQTKMEIELMLKEFGIIALRWTETPDSIRGVELATIEFIIKVELKGVEKEIGFRIKPPLIMQTKGGRSNKITTPAREQSMRLLFWWLKSKLEGVKFGMETIEKTLLSKVMMELEDGTSTTLGEVMENKLLLPMQNLKCLPEFEIKK